jgi:tight adherence protein B
MADDVAPTLDELGRAVGARTNLVQALHLLDTQDRPFAALLNSSVLTHELGVPLADALQEVGANHTERNSSGGRRPRSPRRSARPSAEVGLGLAVLEQAARHGGRISVSLHRAAAAVRDRRVVVAERRVHSAQARLSALVLTLLPLAFALWAVVTDGRVRSFLIAHPLGWACLIAGLSLNALGWWWMHRLTRGET